MPNKNTDGITKVVKGVSFYKEREEDSIWWVDDPEKVGAMEFSFDCTNIYNLFRDYPWNMTQNEKEEFDRENPYWKEFFKDRTA